jgi:hypothetical protein
VEALEGTAETGEVGDAAAVDAGGSAQHHLPTVQHLVVNKTACQCCDARSCSCCSCC